MCFCCSRSLSVYLFQAKSCICHMCGAHLNRLHSCLYCVFFGCFTKKHIHEHAKTKRHNLGKLPFLFIFFSLPPPNPTLKGKVRILFLILNGISGLPERCSFYFKFYLELLGSLALSSHGCEGDKQITQERVCASNGVLMYSVCGYTPF